MIQSGCLLSVQYADILKRHYLRRTSLWNGRVHYHHIATMTPESMIQDLSDVVTYIAGGGLSRQMLGPTKARVVRKMSAPGPSSKNTLPSSRSRKHSIPTLYQKAPAARPRLSPTPPRTTPNTLPTLADLPTPPITPITSTYEETALKIFKPKLKQTLGEPRKSLSSRLDIPIVYDKRARKFSVPVTRGDMKTAIPTRPLNAKFELVKKLTGV